MLARVDAQVNGLVGIIESSVRTWKEQKLFSFSFFFLQTVNFPCLLFLQTVNFPCLLRSKMERTWVACAMGSLPSGRLGQPPDEVVVAAAEVEPCGLGDLALVLGEGVPVVGPVGEAGEGEAAPMVIAGRRGCWW
jgi:hypothetical protein